MFDIFRKQVFKKSITACSLHYIIYKLEGLVLMRAFNKKSSGGVPVVVQWLTNPTRNHEVAGSVPALAQWVNDPALP